MASTAANGARAPRAVLPSAARAAWQAAMPAARSAILSCSSRVRRALARPRPRACAKAMAPSSRSPSITASTMPAATAPRAPAIGLPSVHISSASAGPHKPRQPLRAACAGNDAELHLGLTHLRGGDGDAVVARHRELEAAAERVAVNRGDERLAGVFELLQARVHRLRSLEDCSRVFSCLKMLMSAPAMNVVPAPIRTMASAPRIAAGALDGVADAFGNAGPRAFTGGLSTVTTATRSRTS